MAILMRMKATLNIDERLLAEARRLIGIEEKTTLVHAGIREVVPRR